MFLRDVKKGIAVLFGIAVLSFSVTGCGGGGSGGVDSTPAESERVVIDENNSEQVISTVFNEIGIGFDFESPLASAAAATSVPTVKVPEQPAVVKQVFSTSQNLSILASSVPYECSDGGYIYYSGDETSGTMTFDNCTDSLYTDGSTYNGTASISTSSDGTSATITMTLTDFSITDGSDIIFSGSMTFTSTLYLDESISMSITMDGYANIGGERTDYRDYAFSMSMDSNYDTTFSINGSIRTDCLGGWIEITTTVDIQMNLYEDCPTAGQIVIDGNDSSLTVDFNSDGSVTVSGSVTDYYASCKDVPTDPCSL